MKKFTLLLIVLSIAVLTAKAQHPPHPIHENNPEKVAELYADMLERELLLSKKQYKKVYKVCLKQAKKMQSEMSAYRPAGGGQRPGMGGGHGPGSGQMLPQKGKCLIADSLTQEQCSPENQKKILKDKKKR